MNSWAAKRRTCSQLSKIQNSCCAFYTTLIRSDLVCRDEQVFLCYFFPLKPETAKHSGCCLTRKISSSVSFILDGRRTQRTQGRVLDVDDNKGYRRFQDYSEVKDFQKFQKSCSAPPPKNAGLGCQRGGFGLRQIRNFLLSSFGGDMSGRAGRVD